MGPVDAKEHDFMPYDPATFLGRVNHPSGQMLLIDPSRLVVYNLAAVTALSLGQRALQPQMALVESLLRETIEPVLKRAREAVDPLGIRLEMLTSQPTGARTNQTPWQLWVRSDSGEGINRQLAISLRDRFREYLHWANLLISPVYRLPHTSGPASLLSPLPQVLAIKLKVAASDDPALNERLATRYDLMDADISRYLPDGYRCFMLRQFSEQPVYQLAATVLEEEQDLIDDVFFDFIPLNKAAATFSPNDRYYTKRALPYQWNLRNIQAEAGWNVKTPPILGAGVTVAVIDEGCDGAHPDLQGAVPNPGITITYTGVQTIGGTSPVSPHGTQCAGIIGARYNNGATGTEGLAGIAGSCNILPIRIDSTSDMVVSAAIRYAYEVGKARVISMSFGGEPSSPLMYSGPLVRQSITDAFDATKGNAVLCAATMNNETIDFIPYPAAYPEVLACGASTQDDTRASFSNFGEDPKTGGILSVVAPGVDIPTTSTTGQGDSSDRNYTERWRGTSPATPHVAALAALIICTKPTLTSDKVKNIIETTTDRPASGAITRNGKQWWPELGYGRINILKALQQAIKTP